MAASSRGKPKQISNTNGAHSAGLSRSTIVIPDDVKRRVEAECARQRLKTGGRVSQGQVYSELVLKHLPPATDT